MSLYEEWVKKAYDKNGQIQKNLWDDYIPLEQKIYENIIKNKITNITGTPKELSKKFNIPVEFICGFIDGINDASIKPVDIKEVTEETVVNLDFELENLYKKMVEYKADHLYNLPEWNEVFTEDKRKEIYLQQKKSGTVISENKPGRNEPCTCGSGKKYKKCCGMN